jgi:hypothetical protein
LPPFLSGQLRLHSDTPITRLRTRRSFQGPFPASSSGHAADATKVVGICWRIGEEADKKPGSFIKGFGVDSPASINSPSVRRHGFCYAPTTFPFLYAPHFAVLNFMSLRR